MSLPSITSTTSAASTAFTISTASTAFRRLLHRSLFSTLFACAAVFFVAEGVLVECYAQTMPILPIVQARFFKKVFSYNKSLPKEGVKVLVAFSDASADTKDDIVEAFNAVGLQAVPVKAAQLATARLDGQVVFASSSNEVQAVREYCKAKSLLSVTGFPSFVKNGDISISIDAVNDKAKIVVNTERLKTERQDAADLVRLQ